MRKNAKLMKVLEILLIIAQIAIFVLWFFYFVSIINRFVDIPKGVLKTTINKYSIEITSRQNIVGLILVPVFQFFVLQQIKVIIKDMTKGISFVKSHVNRIYLMALLLATKGIVEGIGQAIAWEYNFNIFISIAIKDVFIGLIIFSLAKIFAHGVEVQTDSDMTV